MSHPTCPNPDKVGYPHKRAALDAWKGLRSRTNATQHKTLAPYRCDCGSWHLGGRRRRLKHR